MTGKQKRYLRSMAHHLSPVVQVGKSGVTATLVDQVAEQLEAHELIKVAILDTSPVTRDEVGEVLVKSTRAELVQTIGRLVVLYRPSKENPRIVIPSKS